MRHAKHMIIGDIGILAALLVFGVPLSTALQYAVLLACPVMMIGMMVFMNHSSVRPPSSGGHDHSPGPVVPQDRGRE